MLPIFKFKVKDQRNYYSDNCMFGIKVTDHETKPTLVSAYTHTPILHPYCQVTLNLPLNYMKPMES